MQRRPDFLILGAQKCATTWLNHHLAAHPDVFMAPSKDTGWFFWERTRGRPDYWEQFQGATEPVLGESSAAYFWTCTQSPWDGHPDGSEIDMPGRIVDELGAHCRFIISLRDPVDRAFSAFLHHLNTGELSANQTFEECMTRDGIVDMGLYAQHLQNWLRHVKFENILLINFDEICHAPASVMEKVYEFLRLDPVTHLPALLEQPIFPGSHRRWEDGCLLTRARGGHSERVVANQSSVKMLQAIYRPDVTRLANLVGEAFVKSWATVAAA